MAVARACDTRAQTVSNWIMRESIPINHWPKLFAMGVSQQELVTANLGKSKCSPPTRG